MDLIAAQGRWLIFPQFVAFLVFFVAMIAMLVLHVASVLFFGAAGNG